MGGWTSLWCIFITNTQWVKVFGWWQTLFYWQKCEEESVGQTGGQTLLHVYLRYFFSSCKLSKTVTVSALLLFGHVTLFCGTYFLSWVKDLCSNQTVRLTLVYPFTLVRFTNNAPLILPPEVYQRWSKISPLATAERFTHRLRRRIGAGYPHPNSSVNGATVTAIF